MFAFLLSFAIFKEKVQVNLPGLFANFLKEILDLLYEVEKHEHVELDRKDQFII
jgi:hypothetical protein